MAACLLVKHSAIVRVSVSQWFALAVQLHRMCASTIDSDDSIDAAVVVDVPESLAMDTLMY